MKKNKNNLDDEILRIRKTEEIKNKFITFMLDMMPDDVDVKCYEVSNRLEREFKKLENTIALNDRTELADDEYFESLLKFYNKIEKQIEDFEKAHDVDDIIDDIYENIENGCDDDDE